MTEQEWLHCGDPRVMLDAIITRPGASGRSWTNLVVTRGEGDAPVTPRLMTPQQVRGRRVIDQLDPRKAGLFLCAISRLDVQDESHMEAIELVEQYASDRISTEEFQRRCRNRALGNWTITAVERPHQNRIIWLLTDPFFIAEEARRRAADALRDIAGNPFRPVAIEPLEPVGILNHPIGGVPRGTVLGRCSWLEDETVQNLALAAREQRLPSGHLDPDQLLVLWDALEDAGCKSEPIREHLCSPLPHWLGCWAVELLLRKGGQHG